MLQKKLAERMPVLGLIRIAALAGVSLFLASYASDLVLQRLKVEGASTVLNDTAIAIFGSAILLLCVVAVQNRQSFARAKERAILAAELNHHIRGALSLGGWAVILDDREERLRRFDEVSGRIDRVLMELVPTASHAETPRYSLSRQDD
jgi:hypothetical protein